jgi:hypothetical protein
VSSVLLADLQQLVSAHGHWVVALIVGLESMGLPLPGETILVLAAIYAATEPSFNVGVVIAVAAFGAIVGDNAGYWLGLKTCFAKSNPIVVTSPMDGSHSLLIRSDSSLALRCRKGAIHPIIRSPRRRRRLVRAARPGQETARS